MHARTHAHTRHTHTRTRARHACPRARRWCEGRKLWGAVINRCRDVARQATQWLPVPEDRALTAAVCRWVSAFPCTLMASLRDDVDLRTCLAGVLLPAELELVMQQQHRGAFCMHAACVAPHALAWTSPPACRLTGTRVVLPLHAGTAVLQMLGVCVKQSHASAIEKLRIDDSISALQDIMGGCERIFRTPIPLSYTRYGICVHALQRACGAHGCVRRTAAPCRPFRLARPAPGAHRHTSRFLVAWLTCLPLCVEEQLGWSTLPLTCALVFFLLGIDEIGVQIEEPFGIMALETFCATVAHNVRQAAAMADAMHAAAALHAAPAQPLASAERTGAADGGPGSSSGSDAERVSGFTPPQPPPGVLPGLLQEQLQLADRSVGLYTSDENDLGGF